MRLRGLPRSSEGALVGFAFKQLVPAAGNLGPLALSWLNAEATARLLIDDQLTIRWANDVGRRWLAARGAIRDVDGYLCAGRFTPELRALLERAKLKPDGTCIPVPDGDSHLILCARLVGPDADRTIFGLVLRRTDEDPQEMPMGVKQAFGLTDSELKVLQRLFRGITAQQSARDLGVSVETVRTHIRRLYQKVGVNSREALLTQVRPFMMVV